MKLPLGQLLSKPSAFGSLFDWLYVGMTSLTLQGNAYGLIVATDGYGFPTQIEWMPPDLVTVVDAEPYMPGQAKYYYYGRKLKKEEIFHMRAFAIAGQTEGISPVGYFQMLIESGHDALAYGADWYKAGGFPPGTFQNTQYEVDDEQSDKIRDKVTQSIRRRQPLVFGRDWNYNPISVRPNEAQFIESMQLNATQIASIYGVPPERIGGKRGDSLTYSTQEGNSIALVTDTLDPWLVRFESALFGLLPEKQYVRFNRDARIRTDVKTRYETYKIARDIGLVCVDELRMLEDREPVPVSDDGVKQGQDYTPLLVMIAEARGTNINPEAPGSDTEVPQNAPTTNTVVAPNEAQQEPNAAPSSAQNKNG
jgi:HK97 family phage portal protein